MSMRETTMDAELKAKWIKALRSGEYAQGKNRLHWPDDGTYCCLGVLARVAGLPITPDGRWIGTDDKESTYDYSQISELLNGQSYKALTDMNDAGAPFSKIASYIENNL